MAWSQAQGVIVAGSNRYRVYMKTVSSSEGSSSTFTLTTDDQMGEVTETSGFGESSESIEVNGYRYPKASQLFGTRTANEVNITENLTKAQLDIIRGYVKSNQRLLLVYSYQNTPTDTEEVIYAHIGTLGNPAWEMPNGEAGTLSYTVAEEVEIADTQITLPA